MKPKTFERYEFLRQAVGAAALLPLADYPTVHGSSPEAELGGAAITFPLSPTGAVSWAACDIMRGKNRSKSYRCELKPGYAFL